MKKYIFSAMLIAMISILSSLEYVPDEIIVKTKKHVSIRSNSFGLGELDNFLSQYGVKKIKPILNKKNNRYYVVKLNKSVSKNELKNVNLDEVEYVQLNYINKLFTIPDDPGYIYQQYYLVNAPKAWDYSTGNKDIIVGLVDSGIHLNHPDLLENIYVNQKEITIPNGANLDLNNDNYISLPELISYFTQNNLDLNDDGYINSWDIISPNSPVLNNTDDDENGYVDDILGWDFVDAPELSAIALGDYMTPDNNPEDENNHGTHVGGIIAADTNNGVGVAGMDWHSKLLIARAGFQTTASVGYLQDDDAAAAVIYAVDNGANVINASWGDYVFSQIISDACQYAYDRGCIVCVASGNTGNPGVMYPAKLSTTIAVGAANEQREVARLTSWGPELDLVAPGMSIYSTLADGVYSSLDMYAYQSGTSMAAPFVTGAVALLLSVQPTLNFEEVRSKIHRTCDDIAEEGFDEHSGAGLLNVYKLILDTDDPYIKITSPRAYSTLSNSFDIIGTVNIPDFFKYSVMYSTSEIPESIDWCNTIYPHTNTPYYYYTPIEDSIIARFDVDETILDSLYRIKIDVQSRDNKHYTYFRNIIIDRSAPVILDSLTFLQERYDDEKLKFFMKVATNEPSFLNVTVFNENHSYQANSDITASTQSILLPDMEDGPYNVRITATNMAGLTSELTLPYTYRIENKTVDINSWQQYVVGDEYLFLNKTKDADNNGKTDFVAVTPLQQEDNKLYFFEVNGNELVEKARFDYSIFPQDLGDTNGHGVEVIGKSINSLGYHYETNNNSFYPDRLFTVYDTLNLGHLRSYYSGNFIDFNNDGLDDIAIKVGSPLYELFVRDHDDVVFTCNMYDNTPYEGQINEFSLSIKCDLLDRDSDADIVAGDSDGDVMVFEYSHGDTLLLPVWSVRLGFPNVDDIAIGRFKNSIFNRKQFCVGGYYKDFLDPKNSYSYYLFFETNGNDNQYIPFGGIGFTNVNPPNYISAADLDGDGFDELVVLVAPNVYIVKYIDDKFVAVWNGKGNARNSNSLAVIPKSESEEAAIIVNLMEDGKLKSSIIKKAEPFEGPPTPENFALSVTRDKKVRLSWTSEHTIDYYKIYKKRIGENFVLADSVFDNNFYLDNEIANGDTLYYKITAYSRIYHNHESLPTHEKMVIIDNFPRLTSIRMDSANRLKIVFDKKLANTAFSVGNYFVNNSMDYPVSVNQIQNQYGVLLTFLKSFPNPQENNLDAYNVTIKNVKSSVGMPFYYSAESDTNVVPFNFINDTISPEIEKVQIVAKNKFKIKFSESMIKEKVEKISNYNLTVPVIDKGNLITNIIYDEAENTAEVHLLKKANKSNQMYFLKIEDLYDLSGNLISNDGNKISFLMNPIKDINEMKVGPNPFHISKDNVLKFFLPLGKKANIKIFNLNGSLVYEDDIEPLSELNYFYSWNGKNNNGKTVGSGIYYYLIKMDKKIKKGKFAVIK